MDRRYVFLFREWINVEWRNDGNCQKNKHLEHQRAEGSPRIPQSEPLPGHNQTVEDQIVSSRTINLSYLIRSRSGCGAGLKNLSIGRPVANVLNQLRRMTRISHFQNSFQCSLAST